ncbi:MAG: RNHCP domain-containing protein [Chloroflexota bacterium]
MNKMANRKFQRMIEDFTCENCGSKVEGSGYTNHCPRCLWSKHVDIQPGDRQAKCAGMMQPIEVSQQAGKYRVLHRCTLCGLEKWNRTEKNDSFEMLLQIAKQNQLGL